jgi:hypothetical protein
MRYVSPYAKVLFFLFAMVLLTAGTYAQNIPDTEIKKNISGINNPLQNIIRLEPKAFEYNKDKFKDLKLPGGRQYGFVTEEVQSVFPELVSTRSYSYMAGKNLFRTAKIKSLDTESLIPILVASIKEQQQEIEKLKTEIQALKNQSGVGSR